jgi:hypothetical protein
MTHAKFPFVLSEVEGRFPCLAGAQRASTSLSTNGVVTR